MRSSLAPLALVLAAACTDPTVEVQLVFPAGTLKRAVATYDLTVVVLTDADCEDARYLELSAEDIGRGTRDAVRHQPVGVPAQLVSVPRVDPKLFLLTGYDGTGRVIAGGCTEVTEPIEADRPVDILIEPALITRVIDSEAVSGTPKQLKVKYLSEAYFAILKAKPELKAALRRAVIAVKIVPVLGGTALRNKGIHPLLDAVIDFLPSPADVPPVTGVDPRNTTEKLARLPKNNEPLAALAFKIAMDEGRKVVFLRVFSGTFAPGDELLNVRTGKKEKVARLFRVHADKREKLEKAVAGEIVAAAGLKDATTGDTMCDPKAPILLERIDTYEPVISQAIEAENNAAKERLDFALAKMVDEDPTFRVKEDPDTGQTIIWGMGELHLEVIVDRMRREYGVAANVGKPQVVYRETVLGEADGHAVFERELKEQRLYGEATCHVRSLPRASGVKFGKQLTGAVVVPDAIVEAALQGLRDAASSGADGFPLEDVEVLLTQVAIADGADGLIGCRAAAAEAFRRAVAAAQPTRLEPIMSVEVTTDDEFLGAIIGDLNQRRGQVVDVAPLPVGLSMLSAA